MKKFSIISMAMIMVLGALSPAVAELNKEQELGKLLYFDRYLSLNHNQSCASCHDQAAGFADPLNLRLPDHFPTSVGSDTTLFGGRNAPPAAYALFSPPFGFDPAEGLYVGGQFWDGRAATLKDQAMGPFLNPVEMAMANETAVIAALKDPANGNAPDYQELFMKVYKIDLATVGTEFTEPSTGPNPDVDNAYDKLAQAIGEFEKSDLFAPFSSKFDAVMAGAATFTMEEENGWALFNGAAQCHLCHPAPLFTDFTYDNLGIPANPQLAGNSPDLGLGAIFGVVENGKFKVSSLRNLDLTAPYGHNGFFVTIKDIVHFYNTRDVVDASWPAPEVEENVNFEELGNLGLSEQEELDLVAFLKTLTDRPGAKSYIP